MAETAQARVQAAVDELINDLDKSSLRKMQGQMHRCAMKCCEDEHSSLERVHHCIEDCSRPVSGAQKYVQSEMNAFQDRLQRCVLGCQDQIRDKVTATTTEAEVDSFRGQFEDCVVKCADEHVGLLPAMFRRMKETLRKDLH